MIFKKDLKLLFCQELVNELNNRDQVIIWAINRNVVDAFRWGLFVEDYHKHLFNLAINKVTHHNKIVYQLISFTLLDIIGEKQEVTNGVILLFENIDGNLIVSNYIDNIDIIVDNIFLQLPQLTTMIDRYFNKLHRQQANAIDFVGALA